MKKKSLLLAIILLGSFPLFSQNYQKDSTQIAKIIYDVFDGMRGSDTSKMAPYMHPKIKTQSLNVGESHNEISPLKDASGWLNAVANNTGDTWDEQINNLEIHSDGAIAIAWMDYKFYLGEVLSHCGTNSFQFIKKDDNWKIIYIIDSRKKENCH
ncbi:MAG: nuclear transport factor 2 family protein [Bacteroidota bacterium]